MLPKEIVQYLGLLSLILMVFIFVVAKSIIAKQFEHSRINRMCIFHVLTVKGLPSSKGASGRHGSPPGYALALSIVTIS